MFSPEVEPGLACPMSGEGTHLGKGVTGGVRMKSVSRVVTWSLSNLHEATIGLSSRLGAWEGRGLTAFGTLRTSSISVSDAESVSGSEETLEDRR